MATVDAAGRKTGYAYDAAGNLALAATLWKNPMAGQADRWVAIRWWPPTTSTTVPVA